jgi:protein required for attachment to host cells
VSDRLGRSHSSTTPARSAIAPKTDPHRAAEDAFAKTLARHLDALEREVPRKLLIFAAPAFLVALRKALSRPVALNIAAEIDRDLVKAPIEDVRAHVRKALFPD